MEDRVYRFADFELLVAEGELRTGNSAVRLQEKPLLLLTTLLENPKQLVTRQQLRERLWDGETFVDYEQGINVAIKKVRDALGDSIDRPRFIETIPKKGYRFIGELKPEVDSNPTASNLANRAKAASPEQPANGTRPAVSTAGRIQAKRLATVAAILLVAVAVVAVFGERLLRAAHPPTKEKITLIVVPLDNFSGDPAQEYFSDGITEEITTQLAQLDPSRLGVIGRLTAMHYKHSGKDIAQIGRETSANYVLEGSVRRDQKRIRATVQLIEVATQTHIWAEEYDRDLGNALSLQQDVAMAVAEQIELKLTPEAVHRLQSGSPAVAEAHDAYLKGRYEWNQRSEAGFRAAIRDFGEALRVQPDYAPAYSGLADSYNLLGQYGFARPEDAYPKAIAYANRALALDDTLAEAYTALADVEVKYNFDWENGRKHFQRALTANPNYATAHLWYAEDYLTHLSKHREAIAEARKAQEIEPVSPIVGSIVAETFYFAHDYDSAIREAQKVLALDPNFLPAIERLGWAYEQKGMLGDAMAQFQKACEISGDSDEMRTQLAHALVISGHEQQARKVLSELLLAAQNHYVSPYFFSVIYTALGDKESAMTWLERSYQARDLPPLRAEPRFDSLRREKRFETLLAAIGPSGTESARVTPAPQKLALAEH